MSSIARRDLLVGVIAAGAAMAARTPRLFAAAAQPRTPVRFDLPAGACDCHTHIFGDPRTFPFSASRAYTPETASVDEMRRLHRALHMDRVVIVQPSIYGTDNRCTLDAIRQLGPRARGVAVVDEQTTDAALDELARGGIRGIRLNLETGGVVDPAAAQQRLRAAAERMRPRRWHIQIYSRLTTIEAIRDEIVKASVPIVIDHFGGAQAPLGTSQPGFASMLQLVREGVAYVKISGAYRSSNAAPDYADVAPLATALVAANPRRIVWGTDWPHPDSAQAPGRRATDLAPLLPIDDGALLNQLAQWVPDPAQRALILVDNPRALYGF
jgi:predicted TIM-barrel fold metal-dependent hydrolase